MSLKNCFYLLFATISLGIFVSCDSDDDNKVEYPRTIQVGNVTIDGQEVTWMDFLTPENDTVYIVNSDEELQQYRRMVADVVLKTDVDYTKNSVLIVGGGATSGIDTIRQEYIQSAAEVYNLNIKVSLNEATEAPTWAQTVVVPKIDSTAVVGCEVIYIEKK